MTEEKRQELFRDAEPAAEGGRFRLVVGVVGGVGVLAVGWILMALNELRGEVRSVQELETEIRGLRAEVAVLKQDSEKEFNNVKETLSGVWHLHKPAELEFMGFFASRKEDERRALLAALEELDGNPPVVGKKDAPVPVEEESSEPAGEESSEPVVEESSEPVVEEALEPAGEESSEPVDEESSEPAGEESSEPAGEESSEPVDEESSEPVDEESSEPVVEESLEPAGEESLEPAGEESSEPVDEESSEPAGEESSEPVDEESSEPVDEESPGPGRAHEETGSEEQVDSQQDGSEVRDYTVQRGDSLSRIAQRHKVSAEALARANGISNPNRIRVGQILKIPPE